jgi:rod shape-determining protein MreC
MLDFIRRHRTGTLFAIFVVVAFGLILLERGRAREMGVVGSATYQATASGQAALDQGLGGVGTWWDRYIDVVGAKAENVRLRDEVNRLRDENARLLGVMQENARLRAMVGFDVGHPQLALLPARVIGIEMSPFFRVISIRIEATDPRLSVGQPVVASAGVVGHISEIAGRSAEVTLAVDPRSSIDVLLQRNRARGVLKGLGHSDSYDAEIAYLLRRDEARPGDIVVTSGMGGRFPPDLVVGRVSQIDDATAGMFQEVTVEPAVDFSRLEEVFIILGTE